MGDGVAMSAELAPSRACPADPVLGFLAQKWLVNIIWLLGRQPDLRFAELRRQLPGAVSAKVLSARLRDLKARGLIERDDKGTSPPHVSYRLSPAGQRLDATLLEAERLFGALPAAVAR
jgi:DNA-binding HxlR family transcriptional regulator